jgi:hypothetical protein
LKNACILLPPLACARFPHFEQLRIVQQLFQLKKSTLEHLPHNTLSNMLFLKMQNVHQTCIHHKLPISQIFNKIYVKIIKQYVRAKSMGFKM